MSTIEAYRRAFFISTGTRVLQKDELARKSKQKSLESTRHSLEIARIKRQKTLRSLERLKHRKRTRDHTLLYYPKAGDEILDSDSSGDDMSVYQRHWFTAADSNGTALNRSARLSQLRSQLRRRLIQLQVSHCFLHLKQTFQGDDSLKILSYSRFTTRKLT